MAIQLDLENFLQGSIALTFIIISFIVGINLLIKYKEHGQKQLLFAGLTWIFLVSPWFNTGFNFLYVIITGRSMDDNFYILLGYSFVPIALTFCLTLFTNYILSQRRKIIITTSVIQGIIYEILLFYFVFTDLSLVATKIDLFNDELSLPFLIYVLVSLITVLIFGVLFGIDSYRSKNLEMKLKGEFILLAWPSFFIGALFDAGVFSLPPLPLIFIRLLLISSAVEFYFSFFLPNW
ncbi:MAG: hypothetical protein EU539_10690, partial [Promethearchaeota archaeon]